MADINPIRFFYQSDKISLAGMDHLFRYITAISGHRFLLDSESPQIFCAPGVSAPDCARMLIVRSKNEPVKTLVRPDTSSNWEPDSGFDPIEALYSKLSFKGHSGPYSSHPTLPLSPSERTLSGLIADFINLLCRAGLIERRPRTTTLWPDPARFGMVVTHDIDIARRSLAGSARLMVNRALPGGSAALLDSVKSALKLTSNPYDAIGKWVDLETELGVKSTFFVFAGDRRHPLDPKYNLPMLTAAFEKIRSRDFEIALHSSIESFSGNGLSEAKALLEQSANTELRGLRPHYLSSFFPQYWSAAAESGFAYSSALGFDQDIGYCDGIDLPFYPFDTVNNASIPLLEIPIAIMDCGLIGDMSAHSGQVFERAMRLIDGAAATSGLIVLDWHQRTFYNRDYPGWIDLFTKIVRYARGKGASFFRMDELAEYFAKRF